MRNALWIACLVLVGAEGAAATMEDAAYEEIGARESADALARKPCNTPEFRQFDFWIGDWDVESAAAPGTTSRNRITLVNDGCTLREEYTTPVGYAGTSRNFYDAARKRWHQTWIDNQGGALYLEGGMEGAAMVLRSVGDAQNVQRITWTRLDDGRVRQLWETTADGGKTWTIAFDGHYTRRPGG